MKLGKRSFSEIIRKIKKRLRLRFADDVHISHVDEIAITPVLKCNLNCVMCHQGEIKCNPNMTFEDFKKVLTNFKKSGVTKMSLVGGEIFVHPQMVEFIREMEKRKFKYDLSSNLFVVPGIEKFNRLKGLEMVTTSIDGLGDVHNKIRRNPKAFENTVENIKILIGQGIRVDVATVVQHANFEDLEKMLEFICKLGVKSITYLVENSLSQADKEMAKKQLKTITGTDAEIYVSSLKNPLGKMTEYEISRIPLKIKNLQKIADKYGASVSFPVQMLNLELFEKNADLRNYTCSIFRGYNGVVYHDGCYGSCGFTRFAGDHSLVNKTALEVLNMGDYFRKRLFFKKNGAMPMCRMCCALKKK